MAQHFPVTGRCESGRGKGPVGIPRRANRALFLLPTTIWRQLGTGFADQHRLDGRRRKKDFLPRVKKIRNLLVRHIRTCY